MSGNYINSKIFRLGLQKIGVRTMIRIRVFLLIINIFFKISFLWGSIKSRSRNAPNRLSLHLQQWLADRIWRRALASAQLAGKRLDWAVKSRDQWEVYARGWKDWKVYLSTDAKGMMKWATNVDYVEKRFKQGRRWIRSAYEINIIHRRLIYEKIWMVWDSKSIQAQEYI